MVDTRVTTALQPLLGLSRRTHSGGSVMPVPKPKMLAPAAAALAMIVMTVSLPAHAADGVGPRTTTPPAMPCPNCPWASGPGMMGPGVMWNLTPEQREEHWRYMHRNMPHGRGMMGPGMMHGPWAGTPPPEAR